VCTLVAISRYEDLARRGQAAFTLLDLGIRKKFPAVVINPRNRTFTYGPTLDLCER
jgi:hypothetical protein